MCPDVLKEDQEAKVVGPRKKDSAQRQAELLGVGSDSLAGTLLSQAAGHAAELLQSQAASDVLVELCCGGCDGTSIQFRPIMLPAGDSVSKGVAFGIPKLRIAKRQLLKLLLQPLRRSS